MSGNRLQRKIVVTNPQGLHMRPQSLFVQLARQYPGTIAVSKGTVRADGKSQLDLMMLAAEQGAELLVEVEGPDTAKTLDALCAILTAQYDEEAELPPPAKGT
jgi:phosphotransferase system HPr (HPr) family protein